MGKENSEEKDEATRKKKKKTERKNMLANLAFNNCVKIIHFRKNKTQTK